MNPTDEKGEISNEFFKKLNQQIVQKDNLIKLLQLQIRNLKSQVEEGGGDKEEVERLESELESKLAETEKLKQELKVEQEQSELISKEKDEQIQELNKLLESQESSVAPVEIANDPRVLELEQQLAAISEELNTEKETKVTLEERLGDFEAKITDYEKQIQDIEQLKIENIALQEAQQHSISEEEIQGLRTGTEAQKVEIEQLNAEITTLKSELKTTSDQLSELPAEDLSERVLELEQDNTILRNLLAEKEEASANTPEDSPLHQELEAAKSEIESLKLQLQKQIEQPQLPEAVETELTRLREENSSIESLKEKIARLEVQEENVAELAMKVTALEAEREQLQHSLEEIQASNSDSTEVIKENEQLKEQLQIKEQELAELRVAAESGLDNSMSDPEIKAEVEQLTQQVADQLLAIQNFEGMLREAKNQLAEKDTQVATLKSKLSSSAPAQIIPVSGENEIITGFIDFFDGLDSILTKNPIPELRVLHQRLMDQLIIPNQIAYVPVISEEFNPTYHVATDYFRSNKFNEKCIVFEVEKGYRKGDLVVKKAKVWVVQNLFNCTECDALQSNADSRFCHLCGAKIVAPNGLPVDSLPEFEPTPTTYLRFAERMLEIDNNEQAKIYLEEGLKIDPGFIPLMVILGELHASNSEFTEAIEVLSKACAMKPNPKIEVKIKDMKVKLSIFKQAQSLKLSQSEFDDLVHIIQK